MYITLHLELQKKKFNKSIKTFFIMNLKYIRIKLMNSAVAGHRESLPLLIFTH